MDYRSTPLFGGLCALLLFGVNQLFGEGTAQLIPSGSSSSCISYVQGNDGTGKEGSTLGRPSTDWIYIHIQDPDQETIYFGLTRKIPSSKEVYYQILAPDGSIHCSGKVASSASDSGYVADNGLEAYVGPTQIAGISSGGYEALECDPTEAGNYAIVFNVGHPTTANYNSSKYFVHPFDITVADTKSGTPTAINGRVFSYKWHLNTNSGSNRACMDFYTWTPDSMVIQMDMNGMQPHGYSVSFNSHGSTNTGDIVEDRKSISSISESVPEYRVFLNEPDTLAFPDGTPGEISFVELNACTLDSSYCIQVEATKAGEVNVYLDLDGSGGYEEGTADVYFPYQLPTAGSSCIPWDGIDGVGSRITDTTAGNVTVEFLAGVVHVPVYDPENHENGYRCAVIRPEGYQPQMYFDNRDTKIGTYDLEGCDSLCNPWTGGKGDKIMVNTWLNTKTSTDTDSFAVLTECPPFAINDTACTKVSHGTQIQLLTNDSDPDNALDPYSVSLSGLSPSEGSATFDSETGLLTFFPIDGDSSDVSFSYRLCDSTSEAAGGPLCDEAEVFFSIYAGCDAIVILNAQRFLLSAHQHKQQAILEWHSLKDCEYYLVNRRGEGMAFEEIGLVKQHRLGSIQFTDTKLRQVSQTKVEYRVDAHFPSQISQSSNVAGFRIQPHEDLMISTWFSPHDDNILLTYRSEYPSQLEVMDLTGRRVHSQTLPSSLQPRKISLSSTRWGKGGYFFRISHAQAEKMCRLHIY